MTWWQRLWRRKQQETELQKELQFHIEERAVVLRAGGLSEAEARYRARKEFGGTEQIKEECRDARGTAWIESTLQDVRYAGRILRKSPAFTLTAIGTLALCSGAHTAIFQLFDAVRLRTLPVPDPQSLVQLRIRNGNGRSGIIDGPDSLSFPLLKQIRNDQQPFSGVLAWEFGTERIGKGTQSRNANLLRVNDDFFRTLQVSPVAGRLFRAGDDIAGCAAPGVVLSYRFWQQAFAADSSAIGAPLLLQDRRLPILGVTPPEFTGPEMGRTFDIALPLCSLAVLHPGEKPSFTRSDIFWLDIMGRLKPGWTLTRASEYLQSISPALMKATQPVGYPTDDLNRYLRFQLEAIPGATGVSHLREHYDRTLSLLMGITSLVLLIASANLANLMLARASARQREFAVRVAIGASRVRLVRQALCESLLLSCIGAFLGLALATVLSSAIVRFLNTEDDPLHLDLHLDWRILLFTTAVAAAVCILLGVLPALRTSRAQPGAALRAAGRGVTADASRLGLQRMLVVLQVSISLVLVTGALLFVASFRSLVTMNPGFREHGMLAASFDVSPFARGTSAIRSYQKQLLEVVRSTPQVEAAASTSNFLIGGGIWTLDIAVPGAAKAGSRFTWISPGYFSTLETSLLAGRDINAHDTAGSLPVAIVNQTFTRRFFLGMNPLGRTFRTVAEPNYPAHEYQIVGLVKDTKYFDLRKPTPPIVYAPSDQLDDVRPYADLYIRSGAPLAAVTASVRREVDQWHADTGMEFHVVQRQIDDSLVRERMLAVLSGLFGMLAMLLATIGLYGVLAYHAARRRNEIGIRLALGATRSQIIALVLGEAALLVAVGLVIGMVGSLALTRTVASLVFTISVHDPFSFGVAAMLLAATAGIGSLLPARRASRLDPMIALRDD